MPHSRQVKQDLVENESIPWAICLRRILVPGLVVRSDQFCHEDRALTPNTTSMSNLQHLCNLSLFKSFRLLHLCLSNILSFEQHLAHAGATGVMARQPVVAWWKKLKQSLFVKTITMINSSPLLKGLSPPTYLLVHYFACILPISPLRTLTQAP